MSNQKKRLGLIVISIIITSFSAGWIIRGFSEDGNPTLDPILGMYNWPWVNASKVNTINYYQNGVLFSGGVTDHGEMTGLSDDDHPQYLFQDGSEEMAADWDAGSHGINASWFEASEFYLNSEDKTDILAYPEQGTSYVIFTDGTNIYAKNGSTQKIDYSGTNLTAIWESTRDYGLTNGRTSIETVIFKGSFVVDSTLIIHSYTCLDLTSAKITLANSINFNIIKLKTSSTYIIIRGGLLDGNKGNNVDNSVDGEQCGIYGSSITFFEIYGTTVQNAEREGFYLSSSSWGIYENIYARDNGRSGIEIDANNYVTLVNPKANDNELYGIDIVGGGSLMQKHVTVLGGSIYGNEGYGIRIIHMRGAKLVGTHVVSNGEGGSLKNNIFLEDCDGVELVGIESMEAQDRGLYIYQSNHTQVIGGRYHSNSQGSAGARYGIRIYDGFFNTIDGTIIDDPQESATQTKGILEDGTSDFNRIINVDTYDMPTGITTSGSNTHTTASWNSTTWTVS